MIQYWKAVLANPDGSPSAKRHFAYLCYLVAAIIALGTFILSWFNKSYDTTLILGLVGIFTTTGLSCLGITSYDYKQFLNAPTTPTQPPTNEIPPLPN